MHRLGAGNDVDALFRQALSTCDIRSARRADDDGSGSRGHFGRVHRMIVVRVRDNDGIQLRDASECKPCVDACGVGRDPTERYGGESGAREEAVDEHGSARVTEQKR